MNQTSWSGVGICGGNAQIESGGDMLVADMMSNHSQYGGGIRCRLVPESMERKKEDEEVKEERDEEELEDNLEDEKSATATNVRNVTRVESSHTAAWTPVRVRKVKQIIVLKQIMFLNRIIALKHIIVLEQIMILKHIDYDPETYRHFET